MIIRIFSIFDPSSSIILSNINWLVLSIPLFLISSSFWLIRNYLFKSNNLISISINKELEPNIIINSHFVVSLFFPIFFIVILNNSIGIFPFIFTSTSHILITLSLALPLWISFIIYGWIKNTKNILSHLIPRGTPFNLIIFIVLIELIRRIIRPLTLAVRLMANITAGHLIMSLIRSQITFFNSSLVLIFIGQTTLIILEIAVSLIQAYVFTILLTIYTLESK